MRWLPTFCRSSPSLERIVVRSLVAALILMATFVATESPRAARQAVGRLDAAPHATAVAHAAGDDGQPEGDSDDGPIDCSIPDNQDDTGCDKGDVEDSQGAIGDSGDSKANDPGGVDNVVPRGAVDSGAGGAAGRLPLGSRSLQAAVGASAE
jgi:hypothetical protein